MTQAPAQPVPSLVLVSSNPADADHFGRLATLVGLELVTVTHRAMLMNALIKSPKAAVVWAIDDPAATGADAPLSLPAIRRALPQLIHPARVFALSEEPLSHYRVIFEDVPYFQHHIYRRYQATSTAVVARLIAHAHTAYPFGAARFFEAGAKGYRLALKRSRQREQATQMVQDLLSKHGVKSRLAARVAQATDELLMNAVFNAPVTPEGHPRRRMLARDADFELGADEPVEAEIICTPQMAAVSVRDAFGSLQKDIFLRILAKDFRNAQYQVKTHEPGAGLGLLGIVQMGLSLMFVCEPGRKTEATLFFPVDGSHKGFKEGFQFVSYFGDTSSHAASKIAGPGWVQHFI